MSTKINKSDMPCDEFINLVRDVKFTYMGKNKYYTPSIEEFFVGFEYEELEFIPVKDSHFGIKIKKNVFVEHIWKTGYSNWQFLDNLKEGKIRVKYLDSNDIEELGFVKTKYCSVPCYEKDCWRIFWFEGNMISIEKFYKEEKEQYFRGWIKNKSELIRLLGWLNV